MKHSSQKRQHGGSSGSGRAPAAGLRRTLACVGASTMVLGAVFAGPSLAYANDAEAPVQGEVQENTTEQVTETGATDAQSKQAPGTDAEKAEPLADEAAADPVEDEAPATEVVFDTVFIKQTRQYQGGAVDVAYELAIPDSVKAGDTIQLGFQAPLDYDNSVEPVLRDANGEVVATGKLTDTENRIITFTFTDYVDKNKNVKIAGEFAMIANDPTLDGNLDGQSTTHQITFTQGEHEFPDTLVIDPHSRTPLTKVFNYGVWTAEDKGHEKPENAILWTANSPEGSWEGMTVTLEPANSTSSFDCSTLKFHTVEVPDGALYHNTNYDNDEQRVLNGTIDEKPAFVESISCDETKVEVTYNGHVDDNFIRQFTIEAGVKDRDQIGHFGSVVRGTNIAQSAGAVACPDPVWGGEYVDYAPACALENTHWYNFVARDAAVGGGTGENRDAQISLEKFSSEDGVEQGDYDLTPGKALKKGATEKITFEITNTGEETLSEIELVDTTVVGPDLQMTSCDLAGVTLAAGESVTCEGEVTLDAPGQHGDTATVTAVARGGAQVTDTDDWWGTVAPDPVVPPVTPEPLVPGQPGGPTPAKGGLALTGADMSWLMTGAAGLLVLAGGAAYVLAARRQAKQG